MTLWWGLYAASAFAATPALEQTASPVALEQSAPAFDFGVSTSAAVGSLGGGLDFGIPDSAPWMDPSLDEVKIEAARKEAARERHPLEIRFWQRLEEDLVSLATWRVGLLDVVRHARGYPQIFPVEAVTRTDLFVEYADTARAAWRRGLDYFLGIDSILSRYAEFAVLQGPEERRAAFAVAFAAAAAQTRFVREWAPYAERDANLKEIFLEPVPSLGTPAGVWSEIEAARLGTEGLRASSYAFSYYRAIGESAALGKVLGRRRRAWSRARSEDLAAAPRGAKRRQNVKRSRDAMEAGLLKPAYRMSSRTVPFDEAVVPKVFQQRPLLPPVEGGAVVTVSSQVIYGIETLRYWLDLDAPQGARPPVLIGSRDIEQAAKRLRPGDILLARREWNLETMGDGGYWQTAGLFVGDEKQRADFFDGASFNEILRTQFPEGYRLHMEGGGSVLIARRRGVGFLPLERFAAADRFAVLRTRLAPDALAGVLERGFSLAGMKFDPWEDSASRDLIGRAELLARAFGDPVKNLLPEETALGRRVVSVNGLARRFDASFGTPAAVLDFVLFLDANESRQDVGTATVEEFRSSWRRPKWTLHQENDR